MGYVQRTNQSTRGMGCPGCGGENDCFGAMGGSSGMLFSSPIVTPIADASLQNLGASAIPSADPLPGTSIAVSTVGTPAGVTAQPVSYSNLSWNPPSQSSPGGFHGFGPAAGA